MGKSDSVDIAIIGAGVVGAALAQRFSKQGRSVVVLEKFERVAEGVTSRNSGVIHSGIYYPPTSLKAKLCVRGQELLYAWAAAHSVPYLKIGKLIVSISAEEDETLENLWINAQNSGAKGLQRRTAVQVLTELPNTKPTQAIFAAETGVIDPYAFTRSLLDDAEEHGALVLTRAGVTAIEKDADGFALQTERGPIHAQVVLNAAGLYADEIARLIGITKYTIHPCRGDYFRLKTSRKFKHLVYPVKAKGAAGLGIHLTLDVEGNVRLGPDTEYVSSKEDFSPREDKLEKFRVSAEKLLGPIKAEDLSYDQCGIRPKLRAPHEKEEKDFVIAQDVPGFINLVGIESPGLTSALAIAEDVEKLVQL